MAKFSDISIGVIVVLIIVVVVETLIIYYDHNTYAVSVTELNDESSRIKKVLQLHLEESKHRPATLAALLKSAKSGFLRGGILGLITYGVEGGIVGGLLLGIVNPIVLGIDHAL